MCVTFSLWVCVATASRPLTFPCTDSVPRERGMEARRLSREELVGGRGALFFQSRPSCHQSFDEAASCFFF